MKLRANRKWLDITAGKIYPVIKHGDEEYWLIDDTGDERLVDQDELNNGDFELIEDAYDHLKASDVNEKRLNKAIESIDKSQGFNLDSGKTRISLVPGEAIEAIAEVLDKNAQPNGKYPLRNWEQGFELSKHWNSLLRHMTEIQKGEHYDPEDDMLHIEKILTRSAMITTLIRRKQEEWFDDQFESLKGE